MSTEYLSFTQLSTFSRCPRLYYYVYEQGIRLPPAFVLIEGRAIHETVEFAAREKIERVEPSPQTLVDVYVDRLEAGLAREEEGIVAHPNDITEAKDAARILLPDYHRNFLVGSKPEEVEKRIEFSVADQPCVGVVDLLEGAPERPRLIDYKVTSRPKDAAALHHDAQLGLYAIATGRDRVAHVQFVRGSHGSPRVAVVETQLRPADLANTKTWAETQAKAICAARASGVWPMCAQDTWWCSDRFCGFYRICYQHSLSSGV